MRLILARLPSGTVRIFNLLCASLLLSVAASAQPSAPPLPAQPNPQLMPPRAGPVIQAQPMLPRLLQPVAPGTVQQRQPLTQVPPSQPELWTFAKIKVELVNPISAKVSWLGLQGATNYRVYRNDAVIAEPAASASAANSIVDDALNPGQTYTYFVEALQKAPAAGAGAVPKPIARNGSGGLIGATVIQPVLVLEKSQRAGVVTPTVDAPRGFNVAILDARNRIVRIGWTAPKWVSSVQILRDGVPLANVAGAAVASFDDTTPAPGSHTYALRTVYAPVPGKPAFSSAPTASLQLRLAPFTIVAIGDSIMWGQGLAETAKFTTLTRETLRSALKVDVDLFSFAHSGAVVQVISGALPTGFDQNLLITPGEVPNSFPTVFHQINVQAATLGPRAAEVDLVLVDGCINDVSVTTILNPNTPTSSIAAMTQSKCSAMSGVLQRLHAVFPNAKIVMTGYYPIVSVLSDLAALPVLVSTVVGVGALAAPLAGIPPDPISAVALVAITLAKTPDLRDTLSRNSATFANASNAALSNAAALTNSQFNSPGLVMYASIPFDAKNSYAAPESMLWLVPTGLYPGDQDDVVAPRRATCNSGNVIPTSVGAPYKRPTVDELALAAFECANASMGHPNRKGSQAYAAAIVRAMQQHMPRWIELYAPRKVAL